VPDAVDRTAFDRRPSGMRDGAEHPIGSIAAKGQRQTRPPTREQLADRLTKRGERPAKSGVKSGLVWFKGRGTQLTLHAGPPSGGAERCFEQIGVVQNRVQQ
jgi:hypothetical protein